MFMLMQKEKTNWSLKEIESIGREFILYVFVHYRGAIINERKESSLSLEIIVVINDHLAFYLLLPSLVTSGRELILFTNPFTNQCSTISIVQRGSMLWSYSKFKLTICSWYDQKNIDEDHLLFTMVPMMIYLSLSIAVCLLIARLLHQRSFWINKCEDSSLVWNLRKNSIRSLRIIIEPSNGDVHEPVQQGCTI